MEEEKAIELLKEVKIILDKHNIHYWLDDGTLLGAVREKKLVPWDHDIDLGMWFSDIEKIKPFFDELEKTDVEVCYFDWKQHMKLSSKYCELDFNLYHKENDKATRTIPIHNTLGSIVDYIIWTIWLKKPENRKFNIPFFVTKTLVSFTNFIPRYFSNMLFKTLLKIYKEKGYTTRQLIIPVDFFTNLVKIEFYNMFFNAPKETEKYLEYRYGDWKIPRHKGILVKEWNGKKVKTNQYQHPPLK